MINYFLQYDIFTADSLLLPDLNFKIQFHISLFL